ncbi:MAG: aminoacyl-tRNA hydrolase [Lactobacillus sp.]|jgi:PTH1 family peptidyl-tRNA hydrolase|nr:aminoacyl-tRNA hydrolase [Lactobacillus sp.]
MFLIVGLGNPGAEYVGTRHNVGFMAVDEIARRYSFSAFKSKFDGLISEGKIAGQKILLLKPQTLMNLSGNSVVKAANYY